MIEYKFNEQYNIIILKRKNDTYEYYLEKINGGCGGLAFMFGIYAPIEPSDFETSFINGFIKNYETQKFWGED